MITIKARDFGFRGGDPTNKKADGYKAGNYKLLVRIIKTCCFITSFK